MIIDPLSLKLFVSIIEEGSIAAAAERGHIAASAVSKRISELEDLFHTQLLRRTNRGVEATDAGITLLQLARGILHDMNNITLQIREYASGIRGHVRLSANISSINQFLPSEIRSFMSAHPQVLVHLEANVSEVIVNAVAENAADVGVITMAAYRHDLEYIPYHTDQLIVITPKEHPLATRRSIKLRDTLGYDFVGLPAGSALHNQLLRAALELDRTPKLRIQVNSFDALCLMVEAGLGIGVVPKGAARPYLKGLRIRSISLNESWAIRELRICVRSPDALPAAARLLVEHLRKKE
ncbi:MAG: LysR family transcriptional regulator [Desulfuromonadales bacterium]